MKALLLVAVFCAVAAGCGRGMAQGREDEFADAPATGKAKLGQLRAEADAAQAALDAAKEKAAALAKAKADAEADVTAAAKGLKDARDSGQGVADAQATRDAQATLDAKVAAMMKTVKPAEDAARAVDDAAATANSKNVEKTKFESDLKLSLAEFHAGKWFGESAKLAESGHLLVVGRIAPEGVPPGSGDRFRYDRFPALERMVLPEGIAFVRAPGQGWMAADPVDHWAPLQPAKAPDDKQSVELDSLAALALRVFHPVMRPGEGALAWTPIAETDGWFVQGREHRLPDVEYPRCVFEASRQAAGGWVLRRVRMPWDWLGTARHAEADYYYAPGEAPPRAGRLQPEELVMQAVRAEESAPRRVDAMVVTKDGSPMRVAGIVSGRDYDLTVNVTRDAAAERMIGVGADAWLSLAGEEWMKGKAADNEIFDLVNFGDMRGDPLWALFLPLEEVDGGPGAEGDGELRLVKMMEGSDAVMFPHSFWLAMKDGKPVLRRAQIQAGQQLVYESIGDFPAGAGAVLPPPGNPAAPPVLNANDLLDLAILSMKETGRWRVDLTVRPGPLPGVDDVGDPPAHSAEVLLRVHGLFTGLGKDYPGPGRDSDLVAEDFEASPKSVERMIIANGKVWYLGSRGKGWETSRHWAGEAPFNIVYLPLDDFAHLACGVCGLEKWGNETLLHIRCVGSGRMDRRAPEFWLALDDAGKPAAVRRCVWDTYDNRDDGHVGVKRTEVVYTKAKVDEKVVEPQGEENK